MKYKARVVEIDSSSVYLLVRVCNEGETFLLDAGLSGYGPNFCIGDIETFDLKIDSVVKFEKLVFEAEVKSYLIQYKGISVEVVAQVSEVFSSDEIEVDVVNFGKIGVHLEQQHHHLSRGQWIKFSGCLSGVRESN